MNKQILITGASKGIGFETAKILADSNCDVTAISRSKDRLDLLSASNKHIHTIAADITRPEAAELIIKHLTVNQIQLDGIIHNAGLLINKPFRDLSDQDWENQLAVNLLAPVRLTRGLLSFLKNGSHILNISSMGGFQGSDKFPGLSGYSASKGALSILTECLASELAADQIFVNCLCLGAAETEMLKQAFPGFKAPLTALEMGEYVADFVLHGHKFYNGKILPVALSNPG
jgi:3-oxoacyl-[acyl-carrier protein] reductase